MAKDFDFYPSGKTSPNLVTLFESHSVISCPYPFTLFPLYSIWQCDQIGLFLEVNGDYFFTKVDQMIGSFLGYFEKPHSYVITTASSFWQL